MSEEMTKERKMTMKAKAKAKIQRGARAARLVKPRTADELFQVLHEFFDRPCGPNKLGSSIEKRKAWDALSGLRGPDNNNYDLKQATTAVIRHRLLGPGAKDCGVSVHEDEPCYQLGRAGPPEAGHFLGHARAAFEALSLSWDKVNKE